jgi:hypothetical protein
VPFRFRHEGSPLASFTMPEADHQPKQQPPDQPARTAGRFRRRAVVSPRQRRKEDCQKSGLDEQRIPLKGEEGLSNVQEGQVQNPEEYQQRRRSDSRDQRKRAKRTGDARCDQRGVGGGEPEDGWQRQKPRCARSCAEISNAPRWPGIPVTGKMPAWPNSPRTCTPRDQKAHRLNDPEQAEKEPRWNKRIWSFSHLVIWSLDWLINKDQNPITKSQ